MNSNILVIGATGNIGRELVNLLVQNGQKVGVLVRSTSNTEKLKDIGVELISGDISDVNSLKEATNGIISDTSIQRESISVADAA